MMMVMVASPVITKKSKEVLRVYQSHLKSQLSPLPVSQDVHPGSTFINLLEAQNFRIWNLGSLKALRRSLFSRTGRTGS